MILPFFRRFVFIFRIWPIDIKFNLFLSNEERNQIIFKCLFITLCKGFSKFRKEKYWFWLNFYLLFFEHFLHFEFLLCLGLEYAIQKLSFKHKLILYDDNFSILTFPFAAIFISIPTFSIHFVIFPFSFINCSIWKFICSLSIKKFKKYINSLCCFTLPSCFPCTHSPVYIAPLVYLKTIRFDSNMPYQFLTYILQIHAFYLLTKIHYTLHCQLRS